MKYYVGDMAYDPNYLEHHGIKGMKWYVRRFQNPDGTLTAAGRARYGNPNAARKDSEAYAKISEKYKKKADSYRERAKFDKELDDQDRKDLERLRERASTTDDPDEAKRASRYADAIEKSLKETEHFSVDHAAKAEKYQKKAEEYMRYSEALKKPISEISGNKKSVEYDKDDDEPDIGESSAKFVKEMDEYFNRAENKERWRQESDANREKMSKARERYAREVTNNYNDGDSQDDFFTEDGGSLTGRKSLDSHDKDMLKGIIESASARATAAANAKNNTRSSKEKRNAQEQYRKNVDKYFADLFGETSDYIEKMPKDMQDAAYAYVYEMWGFNY